MEFPPGREKAIFLMISAAEVGWCGKNLDSEELYLFSWLFIYSSKNAEVPFRMKSTEDVSITSFLREDKDLMVPSGLALRT